MKLEDYKSGLLTVNKLMSILAVFTDEEDVSYDELRQACLDKLVYCYLMMARECFEEKRFLDAYENFNKAGELQPENVDIKIKG